MSIWAGNELAIDINAVRHYKAGRIIVAFFVVTIAACTPPIVSHNAPSTIFGTVTYAPNGATSGAVPIDNNHYQPGQIVVVQDNGGNLNRPGYIFSGWNTQATGTGSTHTPGSTFTIRNVNATLYAQWSNIATHTLTYNANGATGGLAPEDNTHYVPGQAVVVLGDLTRTGYNFAGWNTQSDGDGTSYPSGSKITMNGADVTLYAQWVAGTDPRYQVILDIFSYTRSFQFLIWYAYITAALAGLSLIVFIFSIIKTHKIRPPSRLAVLVSTIIFSFAITGYTVGYVAGNSRTPVMDVVISSVMAFFSSVIAYFFSKRARARLAVIVVSFVCMALTMIIGINNGSLNRIKTENAERYYSDVVRYDIQKQIDAQYSGSIK